MGPHQQLTEWLGKDITIEFPDRVMQCRLIQFTTQGPDMLLVEQQGRTFVINLRAVDMIYFGHDDLEEDNDDGDDEFIPHW